MRHDAVEVRRLAALARGLLEAREDTRLTPFLDLWPRTDAALRPQTPRRFPVVAWMAAAQAATVASTAPLVDLLAASASGLSWGQTYTAADFGETFLARYAWTELIGRRGPFASERLACGILMLGPETEYPVHRHAAEEIYMPLAGTAAWARGREDWTLRSPGDLVHHASWTPHAMRTADDPLIALYL